MSEHANSPSPDGALARLEEAAPAFPGRGLPARTGVIASAFSARYLDPIPYDPADVARIRSLSGRGVVVYTHRSANWVDLLLMQRHLSRYGLPRAEFVGGFDARLFHPFWTWFRRTHEPGAPADPTARDEWRLHRTLLQKKSALVFLKHPATLINPRPREQAHFARAILQAQRALSLPIFLVPQVVVWINRPGHFQPTLGDAVFGTADSPGALRALGIAWLLYRWAKIRVAEPIDVQEFLLHHQDASDEVLARKLRFLAFWRLSREQQILNGPNLKTHKRMRDETLRDPKLQKAILGVAADEQKPPLEITERCRKQYDEVASKFDVDVMSLVDWALRVVWNRIYDGMEVDPADIAKLREVARKASLVMVPCHRSHVDYLVLGQVLYWNGMMPPLVAAGINLSFWPVGPIFRRAGAYFIRRSFKGDALYPHVVRTYLKHMLREGFTQEFFIEGGRSRTGKTLSPKLGMVSMTVDAFLDGAQKDVAFVPVNIGYEKIVESGSYARELAGAEKERENIKALLGATKVLRHRYGRVYVTFDEPVLLRTFLQERGVQPDGDVDAERLKSAVRALGHRIVYGINRCAVVTPTAVAALALLGHHKRGLAHRTLLIYAQRILDHVTLVTDGNTRISPALKTDMEAALREAMTRLNEEQLIEIGGASGEVFYRPLDNKRIYLDYYKNNIVHFFVPDAIVALSLRSLSLQPGAAVPVPQVKQVAQRLSRLLKLEFQFRQGVRFDALFDEALARSVNRGYLRQVDHGIALVDDPLAIHLSLFVSNLIANFVEGYQLGLQALPKELGRPKPRKELVKDLLDAARASFLAGECSRSEAVNKAIMENVVELAVELGLVTASSEDHNAFIAKTADHDVRLSALVADCRALLRGWTMN
jgi:glycerol-3-phosphate O-acyltransferase